MKSLNKTLIIGRLGKDPEEKTFNDGGKIVNATVATSISWKDKASGEWKDKVQWHNIVIKNTYIIEKVLNLKKGDLVYCEGDLEYRKYTGTDGVEKTLTEIVVYPIRGVFDMVGSPNSTEGAPLKAAHTKTTYAELDDNVPF